MQGILLADQSEKLDSMNLLRMMSPIAAAMLLPAVVLLEPTASYVAWRLLQTQPSFAALLMGNASLAYIVNFTNFQITHYTSALTLQVCSALHNSLIGCSALSTGRPHVNFWVYTCLTFLTRAHRSFI